MDWKTLAKPVSEFSEFKGGSANKKTAKQIIAANIDKQVALIGQAEGSGRRWFKVKGENAAFTVRHGGKAIKLLNDETELVVPAKQLAGVYGAIKADLLAGQFDPAIAEVDKEVQAMIQKRSATRGTSTPKKRGRKAS